MEDNKAYTPFELFGIECGSGWHKLLEPIISYVEEYNKGKKEEDQIRFTQIKEKWGGLRVYTNFGTKELYELIDKAEDKSFDVCEFCGSEENVGITAQGWYTTMCIDCLKKKTQEEGYPTKWIRNSDEKMFIVNTDGTMEEIINNNKEKDND